MVYQALIKYSCAVLGALFLYMSLFVYRDNQELIQNKLIEIWNKIKEKQKEFSRFNSFLLLATEKILSILHRFFGTKNISLRLIGTIGVISIFTFLALSPIIYTKNEFYSIANFNDLSSFLLFSFLIISWFIQKSDFPFIVYIILVLGILLFEWHFGTIATVAGILGFILVSLVLDISFLRLLSYGFGIVIPSIINKNKRLKALSIFISGLLVLSLFWCLVYFIIVERLDLSSIKGAKLLMFDGLLGVFYFLAILIYILSLPILIFAIYILFFLIIILNYLVWTLSKGLFRFLFEHEIIKSRKTLAALGVILLLIAFPGSKHLKQIQEFIEKGY